MAWPTERGRKSGLLFPNIGSSRQRGYTLGLAYYHKGYVDQAVAEYRRAIQLNNAYSDAYLYAMIRVGRGLMPEYGSRVTHFDRWHIVNYVRQLQAQAGN